MIWNDVNLFSRDYTNGIKKLNSGTDYKDLQNEKLKYSSKAIDITPEINENGLDEKYTIRPFKLHYDQSFKNMFKNKCTPSNSLDGKVNLSTGSKEIIKMTNKLIPKIDHSGVSPGYYEHKLNEVKSNKDLLMKRLSNADAFAKSFVSDLKKKKNDEAEILHSDGDYLELGEVFSNEEKHTQTNPLHNPSRSTARNRQLLTGLSINPIRQTKPNSITINMEDLSEEDPDEEKKNEAIDKADKY